MKEIFQPKSRKMPPENLNFVTSLYFLMLYWVENLLFFIHDERIHQFSSHLSVLSLVVWSSLPFYSGLFYLHWIKLCGEGGKKTNAIHLLKMPQKLGCQRIRLADVDFSLSYPPFTACKEISAKATPGWRFRSLASSPFSSKSSGIPLFWVYFDIPWFVSFMTLWQPCSEYLFPAAFVDFRPPFFWINEAPLLVL